MPVGHAFAVLIVGACGHKHVVPVLYLVVLLASDKDLVPGLAVGVLRRVERHHRCTIGVSQTRQQIRYPDAVPKFGLVVVPVLRFWKAPVIINVCQAITQFRIQRINLYIHHCAVIHAGVVQERPGTSHHHNRLPSQIVSRKPRSLIRSVPDSACRLGEKRKIVPAQSRGVIDKRGLAVLVADGVVNQYGAVLLMLRKAAQLHNQPRPAPVGDGGQAFADEISRVHPREAQQVAILSKAVVKGRPHLEGADGHYAVVDGPALRLYLLPCPVLQPLQVILAGAFVPLVQPVLVAGKAGIALVAFG